MESLGKGFQEPRWARRPPPQTRESLLALSSLLAILSEFRGTIL